MSSSSSNHSFDVDTVSDDSAWIGAGCDDDDFEDTVNTLLSLSRLLLCDREARRAQLCRWIGTTCQNYCFVTIMESQPTEFATGSDANVLEPSVVDTSGSTPGVRINRSFDPWSGK